MMDLISYHFISFPHVLLIPDHSLQCSGGCGKSTSLRSAWAAAYIRQYICPASTRRPIWWGFGDIWVSPGGHCVGAAMSGRSRSGCRYGNGPQPHNIPQCILDILDYLISDGFGMIWCDVAFGCICIWSPLCPNQRAHETWKNVRLCRPFSGALGPRCLWEDLADPNLHTIHSLHQPVFIHASWTAPSWREDHCCSLLVVGVNQYYSLLLDTS